MHDPYLLTTGRLLTSQAFAFAFFNCHPRVNIISQQPVVIYARLFDALLSRLLMMKSPYRSFIKKFKPPYTVRCILLTTILRYETIAFDVVGGTLIISHHRLIGTIKSRLGSLGRSLCSLGRATKGRAGRCGVIFPKVQRDL